MTLRRAVAHVWHAARVVRTTFHAALLHEAGNACREYADRYRRLAAVEGEPAAARAHARSSFDLYLAASACYGLARRLERTYVP